MKEKKKLIILSSIILGVQVVVFGLTYALFTYNRTGGNSKVVSGDGSYNSPYKLLES